MEDLVAVRAGFQSQQSQGLERPSVLINPAKKAVNDLALNS
jgi:hypothetical protein